jgi:outer membrane protein OmpA-like peptidoglycan-associated protein
MTRFWRASVLVGVIFGGERLARADETFFVAEAPASLAVSDAQEGLFRPGMMPAIGAYASKAVHGFDFGFGVRLRLGVMRNGPAPDPEMHLNDPGVGGMGTLGLAFRVARRGLWLEAVAGGGMTGKDRVPALEAGVGWMLDVGDISVGPSARVLRLIGGDSPGQLGSADLALVGIDVRFGARAHGIHNVEAVPAAVEVVVADPAPMVVGTGDADGDDASDDADEPSCAEDLEGCPVADDVFVRDGRIVLDERVLFDFNKAHVHARGREAIAQIAKTWRAHPEWASVVIEGHCDARGSDEYNQWLSELRAQRARAVLLRAGIAPDRVEAVGYGRSRPRDAGSSEAAHQRNRRVEFVITTHETVHQPAAAGVASNQP